MKSALRKTVCACAASAAVLLTGGVPVSAAEVQGPAVPLAQPVDDDGDGNRDERPDADRGDNGLWGLLGLVGLLGLAGLARRGPKAGAMTGYPTPGADAPPVNTYPPAEPRRQPPGA
ncbi:WGxxGxxG family protein [Amycolatopsis umgeniensis]|uniref:MYXO-CTERM domain-containing protein n=1 Tax=Amycolatopsis umgeniensis TaxID=336628 RepID=A0A841AY41_9PSEU|nr:WGxxGxxG family protein [Amycolatopsis umgeniensis]MBB5851292.1 hypothetical protein [Amycolatopsis umgeniensis]